MVKFQTVLLTFFMFPKLDDNYNNCYFDCFVGKQTFRQMDSSAETSKSGFSFKKRNKCLRVKKHSSESEDEKEETDIR